MQLIPCQADEPGKVGENFDLERLTWMFQVMDDFMRAFLKRK